MCPKPTLRNTRAALFSAVCVTLAASGHGLAAHSGLGVGALARRRRS
jgi:hypothetical protein